MKAIPQYHRGILFRSRTEARWAEFFHLIDAPFEYEPDGFMLGNRWYVPDFRLPLANCYFEVKGTRWSEREMDACIRLACQSGCRVVMVAGNPGRGCEVVVVPPNSSPWLALITSEHRGEGAWITDLTDCDRAFPLLKGMTNCASNGVPHPALEDAGQTSFNEPWESAGTVAARIVKKLRPHC